MVAHRRLLVPARRNADRRVLAGRKATEGRLGARSGRRPLSRTRLAFWGAPPKTQRTGPSGRGYRGSPNDEHRRDSDTGQAYAVDDRPRRLAEKEKHRMTRRG